MFSERGIYCTLIIVALIIVFGVQSACTRPMSTGPLPKPQAAQSPLEPRSAYWHTDVEQQLEKGEFIYNRPATMTLGAVTVIELAIQPKWAVAKLEEQVIHSGELISGSLDITPRMRADLWGRPETFTIERIGAPVQKFQEQATYKWAWKVTANKAGNQTLVLTVYCIYVQKDKSEVESLFKVFQEDIQVEEHLVKSYSRDIQVTVVPPQGLKQFDSMWLVGILLLLLLGLAVFFLVMRSRWQTTATNLITDQRPLGKKEVLIQAGKLRQNLATYFSESELRDLCFDLGIDYETLPGTGKGDKVRELILYCIHHDCIRELAAQVSRLRPTVNWEDIPE